MAKKQENNFGISEYALESFARRMLPLIQQYFETEEGQQAFENWKKQQINKEVQENG